MLFRSLKLTYRRNIVKLENTNEISLLSVPSILVTGLPGSGKSTLATHLSAFKSPNIHPFTMLRIDDIASKVDNKWLVDVAALRTSDATLLEGTCDNMQDVYRVFKPQTIILVRPDLASLRKAYSERCNDPTNLFKSFFCSAAEWKSTQLEDWMSSYATRKLRPFPNNVRMIKLVRSGDTLKRV